MVQSNSWGIATNFGFSISCFHFWCRPYIAEALGGTMCPKSRSTQFDADPLVFFQFENVQNQNLEFQHVCVQEQFRINSVLPEADTFRVGTAFR